jgi:hypothetical protein
MQLRLALPLLAALVAPAFAQDAQAPRNMPMSQDDMAKFHDRMCTNHYAHAVGGLAALEVELKLTSAQKPLFERWKSVKLAHAKDASAKCAEMKMPPDRNVSIVDARKRQITRLEAHLANLKAEMPSLEALVNALDKDQQQVLRRAGRMAMEHHMNMAERFFERRGHGGMRQHGDMPPPPPPAN